ncbi:MAG TPA: dienelactone hydrolase family protein [Waddliaceae bacterium]
MKEENVQYFENVMGFYVEPADVADAPGVVMIHEAWGLNENIKNYARKLAGEGYRVLAVDMFGEIFDSDINSAADDATRQKVFAKIQGIDQDKATANLRAAVGFLRQRGAKKVGSIGWCFGGAQSLQLAVSGEKMDATVIYYGRLFTDADKLSKITWPVLGIFAALDAHITPAMVKDFETALKSLHVTNEIIIYPNVNHAFANPTGQNFSPTESADAWIKTIRFFKENLKG